MSHLNRMVGDSPGPGEAKLRVRSNGYWPDTEIVVVDDQGVERHLLGVEAVSFKARAGDDLAEVVLEVREADVVLDAERAKLVAPAEAAVPS